VTVKQQLDLLEYFENRETATELAAELESQPE
jgi:hypothetical protein